MAAESLTDLARLLQERNLIDKEISKIIDRPMTAGHAGEWIAAQVFDIELESNASMAAYDGRFRREPLADKTVNVKWYLKQDWVLDITTSDALDYYLVMTGWPVTAASKREKTRPWVIESVYLFDARHLLDELRQSNVKIGVATSIRKKQWSAAEIYRNDEEINASPRSSGPFAVSDQQNALLRLFAASACRL